MNLAPGRHTLSVDATFDGVPEGRLGHLFEEVVTSKAPTQPTRGRTLALTG